MEAFADVVRQGKALLHRSLGVDRRPDPGRPRARPRAAHPVRLEPAAVQHAVAGHRGRGRPDLDRARHRPDRLVADRAGRAHRQVPAGQPPPAGSRAAHEEVGLGSSRSRLTDDVLTRVQRLTADRRPGRPDACAQLAVAWVLANPAVSSAHHRRVPARAGQRERQGSRPASSSPEVLAKIDDILDPVVERDPAKTHSPATRDFS